MSANAPMIIQKAMVEGRPAEGVLPSGQVAGVIDRLLTCEALISDIVAEAEQRLSALAGRVDQARSSPSSFPFARQSRSTAKNASKPSG